MSSETNHSPSRIALKLLRWFCPEYLYEGIEGDLLEQFYEDVSTVGHRRARWRLVWHVIRFFRPGILLRNRFSIHLIPYAMIRSYFTIALRSIARNQMYTFINIAGLTLGLTIGIVLFWVVRFEYSFDTFHENSDRLYQIISNDKFGGPSSHVPQGVIYALQQEFPEVERASTVYGWVPQVIRVNEENVKPGSSFFIHPQFFEMIDVKWISGSVETSFNRPFQVVLDDPTAKRLFPDEDPIGKVLRYDNAMDLTVSGIIQKMPTNTMLPMPMIMSYETLTKYMSNYGREAHWGGGDSWFHGYVLLKPGADPASVEARLNTMVKAHEQETTYDGFRLSPLPEEHFDLLNDPFNYVAPEWMLHVLLSVALFLIIIACINFINLATAQATQRSREIGVRKTMGSSRGAVVFQFLVETFVLVTISVLLSALIATELMRFTDLFLNTQVSQTSVWNSDMILYLTALVVIVTLLAGLYPAFILSGFKPVRIFRAISTSGSGRGITMRKSLVVTQFVIAQVMVICTVIGVRQVQVFYKTDPGFDRDAVVTVNMVYKDSVLLQERFHHELLQHPEIKNVSFGLTSPSSMRNWWWGKTANPKLTNGEQQFRLQWVDENYFDFYSIPLVAGRNFLPGDTTPVAMVNERVVAEMGLSNPEDVLGEQFIYWGDNKVTIIGVVKNYYSQSLKSEIPPHLYMPGRWNFQLAQIKIDPSHTETAIKKIERHWRDLHPDNYFEYDFLADDLESFYEDERKLSNLIILFASLSLTIGCLGLFGVVSFVCSRRTKEVSIRKVLGATVMGILSLLSRDFVLLVVTAFGIAVPIGYFLMREFLERYTYQTDIHWSVFALAGGVTLVVAVLTVIIRSLKVAFTNPADNLKYE